MGEPSSWGTKELQDAAISKLRQGETAHHTGSLLTVQIPQSSENFDAPTVVKHISGPDARKRFVGGRIFRLGGSSRSDFGKSDKRSVGSPGNSRADLEGVHICLTEPPKPGGIHCWMRIGNWVRWK